MTEDLLDAGEMAAIQRLRDADARASLAGDARTLRSLLTSGAERQHGKETTDLAAYKVMRILKRQADGSWKVHRVIWNDAPAASTGERAGPPCSY